jgi:hypothetical protein
MRIHAREQDIQRKVNVALARAKRAEGLVAALRHENASLRAKLKMLDKIGMDPAHNSSSHNNDTEETPTTKAHRINMLRCNSSTAVETPPTQRGDFVAKKLQKQTKRRINLNASKGRSMQTKGQIEVTTSKFMLNKQEKQQKKQNAQSFLDVISSDLPRASETLAKSKMYPTITLPAEQASNRLPLGTIESNTVQNGRDRSGSNISEVQTIEL